MALAAAEILAAVVPAKVEPVPLPMPAPESHPVSVLKSEEELSIAPVPIPSVGEAQESAAKDDDKVRTKPKTVDPGQPPVRSNLKYGLLLALVVLVPLVLAFAALLIDLDHAQPASAPKKVATPSAPPEHAAPLEVSLDFTQDCWVEAVIDGKNRISELRVQGEALQLEAEKSIALTLGNAGAVEVQVNGYPLELGKKNGDIVRGLLIDLNTAQTLKAKKGPA